MSAYKINCKNLCWIIVFSLCAVCVVWAQDGPVLGRGSQPTSPPERRKQRRHPIVRSGVPKGKTLDFYVRKGSELIDASDYDLAAQYFEEAERRRKDKTATSELLELLDRQQQVVKLHLQIEELPEGQEVKELELYEQVLRLRPNDQKSLEQIPLLYKRLGEAALSSRDYKNAADYLEKLLKLNPEDSDARSKIVQALLALSDMELASGDDDAARKTLLKVTEYEPKNQKALDGILKLDVAATLKFAENKLAAGAYEDAMLKFREVVSLDPENKRAKKGLKLSQGNYQKQKADQYYANRKYLDAEREYRAAAEVLKADEHILRRLEEISLRMGPPLPSRGRSIWRGKVLPGTVKIRIRGREVSVEGGVENGSLSDRLPEVPFLVKRVRRLTGTAVVRQAESPSPANGFTAGFALDVKKEEEASFEIEWELRRQGIVTWSGQITGRSIIRIQGPFVDVEQIGGGEPSAVKMQTDGLPHQGVTAKLKKLSGKSEISLLEQPSESNLYTAIIAVDNDGTDSLAFEFSWQLK